MTRLISIGALVVVVAAGCGGSAQPRRSAFRGLPSPLAQTWAGQASAIAKAASAGNSCHALDLANSLRSEVVAAEHKLPFRLRSPLVTGVNRLANQLTCKPPTTDVGTTSPKPSPKPPHDKKDHHEHDHGHHGHGHDGGDGGGDR